MPAHRRAANLRLSFQRQIGNAVMVDSVGPDGVPVSLAVPVYQQDPLADPDSARDPNADPDRAFVVTQWLSQLAGRKGYSIVQMDCYVRIGPQGAVDSDPFGILADDLADAIETVFAGVRAAGPLESVPLAEFPILDFSADPSAPTPTGHCLRVQRPGGGDATLGCPQDRTAQRPEGGMWRTTVTFAMRTVIDAVEGHPYRDVAS